MVPTDDIRVGRGEPVRHVRDEVLDEPELRLGGRRRPRKVTRPDEDRQQLTDQTPGHDGRGREQHDVDRDQFAASEGVRRREHFGQVVHQAGEDQEEQHGPERREVMRQRSTAEVVEDVRLRDAQQTGQETTGDDRPKRGAIGVRINSVSHAWNRAEFWVYCARFRGRYII